MSIVNGPLVIRTHGQSRMKNQKSEESIALLEPTMGSNQLLTTSQSLHQFQGIFYSMTAGFCISITGIAVKFLEGYSAMELGFFRFLTTVIFALPILILCPDTKYREMSFKMLPVCSIFWVSSLIFRYMSYEYMPLGEAQVLALGNVFFVVLMERIFLKEKFNKLTEIAVIVSSIGLCLIAKIPDIITHWSQVEDYTRGLIGMAYGLASSTLRTIHVLINRAYFNKSDESLVTFSVHSVNTIIIMATSFALEIPMSLTKNCNSMSWLLVVFGLIGYVFNKSVTKALQTVNACTYSILQMGTDVSVAVVSQTLIFGEPITLYSGFGFIFVLTGALIPPFQKWVLLKPSDHKLRRKLEFLLK